MSLSIRTDREDGKIKIECESNSLNQKLFLLQSVADDIQEHLEKIDDSNLGDHPSEERTLFEFKSRILEIAELIDSLDTAMDLLPEEIKATWFDEPEVIK